VIEGVLGEVAACVRRAADQAGPLEKVVYAGLGVDRPWVLGLLAEYAQVEVVGSPLEEPSAVGAAQLAAMGAVRPAS
jgi:hypothetical protein